MREDENNTYLIYGYKTDSVYYYSMCDPWLKIFENFNKSWSIFSKICAAQQHRIQKKNRKNVERKDKKNKTVSVLSYVQICFAYLIIYSNKILNNNNIAHHPSAKNEDEKIELPLGFFDDRFIAFTYYSGPDIDLLFFFLDFSPNCLCHLTNGLWTEHQTPLVTSNQNSAG